MRIVDQYFTALTRFATMYSDWFSRFVLFFIYFYFGLLKPFGFSPLSPMVEQMQQKTLPFIEFNQFIILLTIAEVGIAILFLIPKFTRIAVTLVIFHVFIIMMPLVLLPDVTWKAPFIPTIEGQYCLKNLLILALVLTLVKKR